MITVISLEPTETVTVIPLEVAPDAGVYTSVLEATAQPVQIDTESITVIEVDDPRVVNPIVLGPIGIEGPQGPIGLPGGAYHLHTQASPTSTWDIQHDKGVRLNITLLNDDHEQYFAKVVQDTVNHVYVYHNQPQSGKAVLS